jgi:hypothetical protein
MSENMGRIRVPSSMEIQKRIKRWDASIPVREKLCVALMTTMANKRFEPGQTVCIIIALMVKVSQESKIDMTEALERMPELLDELFIDDEAGLFELRTFWEFLGKEEA